MDNVEHLNAPTDSLMFFKLEGDDFIKNKVSWCLDDEILFKFPFPLERLDGDVIKQLNRGYKLTSEEHDVRNTMLMEGKIDEPFLYSIFAHVVLEKSAVDLINKNLMVINSPNEYPLKVFVKEPTYTNIFFVIDGRTDTLDLLCVEVDPYKEITFRLVWLNLRQVSKTQWEGPKVELGDIKELFSLTEQDFYSEIEKSKKR